MTFLLSLQRPYKLTRTAASILLIVNSFCAFTQHVDSSQKQVVRGFFARQAAVKYVYQTAISPDGTAVAWSADTHRGVTITIQPLDKSRAAVHIAGVVADHVNETEPQWSPDGKSIAFLSDAAGQGQPQVYLADAGSGKLLQSAPLTSFDGFVSHLKWAPNGRSLSVLYVHKATREPSPMAAENKAVGLIDSMANGNVQAIMVIDVASRRCTQVSPPGLYIFEYDWSPDSKEFAYTAAVPPGDDNWYIARLYRQHISQYDSVCVHVPEFQIALPRWSSDGRKIGYIEGLMSDQGGTGGEIFTLEVSQSSTPENLTPDKLSTPSWFTWTSAGTVVFSEFWGGSVAVNSLDIVTRKLTPVYTGDESMRAGNEEMSLSIATKNRRLSYAYIRTGWNQYPEVWAGEPGRLRQISTLNNSIPLGDLKPVDVRWTSDGQPVQGWLLPPVNYDSTRKYPMLVCVHGGPAWITTPTWSAPDFNSTVFPQLGYFVFFPNPQGSYGQGEKFTKANRRDWGFGDLRDILRGVDAVAATFPVDTTRMGIYGWSYGGSMAMFAVTQTSRFRAAVAGAGAGDWLSYYGQNSIDKWMQSYFNVSPYEDAEPYRRLSAMTYIKNVRTPVMMLVGERDGECPPPQSFQYWHALKELKVPTQLMVYADEGHSFNNYENMIDVCLRTLGWFNQYLSATE